MFDILSVKGLPLLLTQSLAKFTPQMYKIIDPVIHKIMTVDADMNLLGNKPCLFHFILS